MIGSNESLFSKVKDFLLSALVRLACLLEALA